MVVKNLSAMQETPVQSLGREDSLEKGMATHFKRIPWTEEPGGLQSMELQRVGHDWTTNTFAFTNLPKQFWDISLIEPWNLPVVCLL